MSNLLDDTLRGNDPIDMFDGQQLLCMFVAKYLHVICAWITSLDTLNVLNWGICKELGPI